MRADEIMTSDVATVRAATSVREAAALLAERGITSMPVLDDDGRVVGMVSESDLLVDRMPHDPRSHLRRDAPPQRDPARTVESVMTRSVLCLGPHADVADIASLMWTHDVRAVPIVDGAHLLGIVSRRDLLRTLLRDDAAVRAEVRERLAAYAGELERWKVAVDDGVVTIRGRFDDARQEEVVTVLAQTVPGALRVHTHHAWRS
jgi:CBS domain-containing protein